MAILVQAQYAYKYHCAYRPGVIIRNTNGSYMLEIEGMTESIRVTRLNLGDVIESKISGEYKGWNGETTFKLENGQIWQQEAYAYKYHYAYRPDVLIYK